MFLQANVIILIKMDKILKKRTLQSIKSEIKEAKNIYHKLTYFIDSLNLASINIYFKSVEKKDFTLIISNKTAEELIVLNSLCFDYIHNLHICFGKNEITRQDYEIRQKAIKQKINKIVKS